MPPLYAASSNHNFGHIREPHIFRDLCRHIFTMRCDNFCASLTALYVQTPGDADMNAEDTVRLQANMRLGQQLGAEM